MSSTSFFESGAKPTPQGEILYRASREIIDRYREVETGGVPLDGFGRRSVLDRVRCRRPAGGIRDHGPQRLPLVERQHGQTSARSGQNGDG